MIKIRHTAAFGVCAALVAAMPAHAVPFTSVQIFGDSYSDTGAGFALTNGGTAASYLAQNFGSTVALPSDSDLANKSINFAESGARVGVEGPGSPASLTSQVQNFANLVSTGATNFDPSNTLFFLSGGLNDHDILPASEVTQDYAAQVDQLVSLGARYIEIALLPGEIPAFTDSAVTLNPAYRALVPELDARYSGTSITLSDWGTYYDDILRNPDAYGFTNVTDACLEFGGAGPCANPDEYFYYYSAHPSDAAHKIVGARLADEALSIASTSVPAPASLPLFGAGIALVAAGSLSRRRRGATPAS